MKYEIIYEYVGEDEADQRDFNISITESDKIEFPDKRKFDNAISYIKDTDKISIGDKKYSVSNYAIDVTSDRITFIVMVDTILVIPTNPYSPFTRYGELSSLTY